MSGGFQHGTFNDDARTGIFPKRDEQSSGNGDDHRLLEPSPIPSHLILKPKRQCGIRLVADPQPDDLDQRRAQTWIT